MNKDKNFLLNQSKSFCMLPWLHIHTTPVGKIMPCCVADMNIDKNSLRHAFHSEQMNKLRKDMLAGIQNNACNACYKMDPYGETSRKHHNKLFAHRFDELVPQTHDDGSLDVFKLHYYDIRFSNICNMKCRMCNSDYSSQWALENGEYPRYSNDFYLIEVLERIDNLELAYFAGGEPLISEHHYTILEELIRKNKDIPLIYSTNASTLRFKNKDLLNLWKHFTNIDVRVSMDHYGERAEYIRHGTDWEKVKNNILLFKDLPNVKLSILTVVNLYNYLDLPDIHQYIINNQLLKQQSNWHLFKMNYPEHLTTLALPESIKNIAKQSLTDYVNSIVDDTHEHVKNQILSMVKYTESENTYEQHKEQLKAEILRLDNKRDENFAKTFPHLETILNG